MILIRVILSVWLTFYVLSLKSQQLLSWDTLALTTWNESGDSSWDVGSLSANFSPSLQRLNGQEVVVDGYVIGLDAMGLSYALSRYSFAACFFCGKAGPETVMDLKIKPKSIPSYELNDTQLKFKGVLELREDNPNGFNVILTNAIKVRE